MCRLRNIAMPDYQESATTRQADRHTHTDRRRTKWSLCAAMLRRRHNKRDSCKGFDNRSRVNSIALVSLNIIDNTSCKKKSFICAKLSLYEHMLPAVALLVKVWLPLKRDYQKVWILDRQTQHKVIPKSHSAISASDIKITLSGKL